MFFVVSLVNAGQGRGGALSLASGSAVADLNGGLSVFWRPSCNAAESSGAEISTRTEITSYVSTVTRPADDTTTQEV